MSKRMKRRVNSLRIGIAGWTIRKDLSGLFGDGGSHLERYATRFNAVEINSSFKSNHQLKTYERWAANVPTDFRFSVKAPKAISHDKRLVDCENELDAFLSSISGLGEKLGPVLIQLPPTLGFERASVQRFLKAFRMRAACDAVCEPRHQSWFTDKVDKVLVEHKVARVSADPARFPGAATPPDVDNCAYFRLHGSPHTYYSSYSEEYLFSLRNMLVRQASVREIWCIFDNTAAGEAIANGLKLQALLGENIA